MYRKLVMLTLLSAELRQQILRYSYKTPLIGARPYFEDVQIQTSCARNMSLLWMPTTQLTMKLCCIICIVCLTSEVMMDDSSDRGMNSILPNFNCINLNVINLQDTLGIDGVYIAHFNVLYSCPTKRWAKLSTGKFSKNTWLGKWMGIYYFPLTRSIKGKILPING